MIWLMPSAPNTAAFRAARDSLLATVDEAASFRWPDVGKEFNWATDWFDIIASGNDQVALWIVEEDGSETQVTFAEMAQRSDRVATYLHRLGVGQGDHVLLMLGNQVELWETMLAVMKLGAVILPTTTMLEGHDLQDRITRGHVAHVVTNASETGKFDQVTGAFTRIVIGGTRAGWTEYPDLSAELDPTESPRPRVRTRADDPCLIYFTSGTTSKPKMVVHTQTSYPVGHLSTMYWLGLKPGDVQLAISSPGWGKHAWSCFFSPWIAEATVFVYNYDRFNAPALLTQLERAQVTTFCAPPTVWRLLIQADLRPRPTGLREIVSAGEPLNPEVIARVNEAWGLVIRDGYGQTETTAIIGNPPGAEIKPGSMGVPLPGVTVTLLDPITGEAGNEGEVCLDLSDQPTNLMASYYGDLDRTTDAMRDGHFHTGDVAARDADGFITFIGRTDDIFKSSDYKVSPFEVESVLLEHPAVAESAVVPAPDEVKLNVVKAYITLASGWEPTKETALAILGHARTALPAYERVRRVEFGPLPKTISGKIRRVELRDVEAQAALPGAEPLTGEWRDSQFPELTTTSRPTNLPRGDQLSTSN